MPRFMFDTNIISYTMKHPVTPLAKRYRGTLTSDSLISSVVEAELRYGVARLPKEAKLHGLVEAALGSLVDDYVFEDVPGLHVEFWAKEPEHGYR